MKVQLVRGNEVVFDPIPMDDTITKQQLPKKPIGEQRLHAVLEGRAISKKSDEEVVETLIVTPPVEETATEEVETNTPAEEVEIITTSKTEDENVETDEVENTEASEEEETEGEETSEEETNETETGEPDSITFTASSSEETSDNMEDESEKETIVAPTDLVADEEDSTVQEELDDLRFIPHPSGRVQAMKNKKFISMKDIPEDKIPDWVKEANAKADTTSSRRRERKSPKTVHIPASK